LHQNLQNEANKENKLLNQYLQKEIKENDFNLLKELYYIFNKYKNLNNTSSQLAINDEE
jgi:hypothetical protein